MVKICVKCSSVGLLLIAFVLAAFGQQVPAPRDVLGFTPGDDRKLASWEQVVGYFKKLDAASPRVTFEEMGKTTMGRPFVYSAISSPDNIRNLEKFREINAKLADPRKIRVNDAVAKQLVSEGKTVVLITFGIHSTEVGSTLSSMLIAHRLASSDEPEIRRILDNTIILIVPSLNPDGLDIVKNWYDKTLGTPFEGTEPPELYHKYTGHDNNRDWYAFTQAETRLTVDRLHNIWHPQIVHDVHQQGPYGSRLFLPPYHIPVEPNVPKEIVDGYTELGTFMAGELRKQGFSGITYNSIYDAWTPARAYSHYHGGVRILSESASARIATPISIKFDELRGGLNYDPKKESDNFGPVWNGGEWGLRDITSYMSGGAFALMRHAADNRQKWLERFYVIGKEAVRPRKAGETRAYIVEPGQRNAQRLLSILDRAGIEIKTAGAFAFDGRKYPEGTQVIQMDQPYAAFVSAMVEPQKYPDLLDENGSPVAPYDVTAHSLSLLMNVRLTPVKTQIKLPVRKQPGSGSGFAASNGPVTRQKLPVFLYQSFVPSMDEGWTRWVLDDSASAIAADYPGYGGYRSARNADLADSALGSRTRVVVFPDQSPGQMFNGHQKGRMPDEFTGGIGKAGVENLRRFVEDGGTLVFLNRASDFAISRFKLPLRDVTDGVSRKVFYIPGSILRTEIDTAHPLAKGMPAQSIAWFEESPAFEVLDPANVRVIAKYPSDPKSVLLSGWVLGAERIAGKAAMVEVTIGKGRIILFGFRPQYRGQSLATFPLFFNSIAN